MNVCLQVGSIVFVGWAKSQKAVDWNLFKVHLYTAFTSVYQIKKRAQLLCYVTYGIAFVPFNWIGFNSLRMEGSKHSFLSEVYETIV